MNKTYITKKPEIFGCINVVANGDKNCSILFVYVFFLFLVHLKDYDKRMLTIISFKRKFIKTHKKNTSILAIQQQLQHTREKKQHKKMTRAQHTYGRLLNVFLWIS